MEHFIGVDVGTASVRAGLFDRCGRLVDAASQSIQVHTCQPQNVYEQSSEEIWRACIAVIHQLVERNCGASDVNSSSPPSSASSPSPQTPPPPQIRREDIVSIGFDATCSLVVLDQHMQPVCVTPLECRPPTTTSGNSGGDEPDVRNVIMWMDHRASEQAERINATRHPYLARVGGKISVEMDPPKLLWLKERLHDACFRVAAHFFSLPDFLVWRCTNDTTRSRSVCSAACKWLLDSHSLLSSLSSAESERTSSSSSSSSWSAQFWQQIGLHELNEHNFARIGSVLRWPFAYTDELCISAETARRTGLVAQVVRVGVSMIDAHAGGIGALVLTHRFLAQQRQQQQQQQQQQVWVVTKDSALRSLRSHEILVLVSGTSSCMMASARAPVFVRGVWGPYYAAMLPGLWLSEAGQSACGQLIDRLVQTHPAYAQLLRKVADERLDSVYAALQRLLIEQQLAAGGGDRRRLDELTRHVHVYPDFHGNRSPIGDESVRGQLCGLTLDTSLDNLAVLYLATLQALAYQTKQIVAELVATGQVTLRLVAVIGGLASNALYCQLISDVCELPVLTSNTSAKSDSAMMLGAAILGASNATCHKDMSFEQLIEQFAMSTPSQSNAVSRSDSVLLEPNKELAEYHARKYAIFLNMMEQQLKYKQMMTDDFKPEPTS